MGGDSGSNSSPPVDVQPGGGTYPTNAFGEAYNPAWYSGGGGGNPLAQFGQSVAQGSQAPNFMTGAPNMPQFQVPSQQQSSLIQTTGAVDQQQLLQLIQRMLSSGGGGY